jgi:hypothetical protein
MCFSVRAKGYGITMVIITMVMHCLHSQVGYSETCSCDNLCSETTSIPEPLGPVPKVAIPYISTSIMRPPLLKGHFFWPSRGHLGRFHCTIS